MVEASTSLERLLPIHAARERRAQQELHQRSQSYENARRAHLGVLRELRALERSIEQAFVYVLDGGAQSAGDAQAAIALAELAQSQVPVVQGKIENAHAVLELALLALDEARRRYADRVRTGHKMRETCTRQSAAIGLALRQRTEELMEDEFVPCWVASQKVERAT